MLSLAYLRKGHGVHFRCYRPEVEGIRIDVMSVLRGVASFPTLWRRRTTVETEDGMRYDLMSLPDLVKAKKTQRDKDWPMLRRLVEAHYEQNRRTPTRDRIRFWLREARTPELLIDLVRAYPEDAVSVARRRALLALAKPDSKEGLVGALEAEERLERERDRAYWGTYLGTEST